MKLARRKVSRTAGVGTNQGRIREMADKRVPKSTKTYDMMTKMNPYGSEPQDYATLKDMIKRINNLKKQDVKKMTDKELVPFSARLSIILFVEDWAEIDPDHEQYLSHVPKGFDRVEALKMGDLLYWCIVGGAGLKALKNKSTVSYQGHSRWEDYIKPKMPMGVKMTDLVGLHAELLTFLPQSTYNQYTINQLFTDDEKIYDQMFDTFVQLDPMQHDALQTMGKLVDGGNIEKFRLSLMKGSRELLSKLMKEEGAIGHHVLDAFDCARKASQAYRKGDYREALAQLNKLENEYEISPSVFQVGLEDMFAVSLGVVMADPKDTAKELTVKSDNRVVLCTLDQSIYGDSEGFDENVVNRVKDAMNGPAFDYGGSVASVNPTKRSADLGQGGRRLFKSDKDEALGTDWLAFFAALNLNKDSSKLKPGQWLKDDTSGWTKTARLLVHGDMSRTEGMQDLMPKGVVTISITLPPKTQRNKPNQNDKKGGKKGSRRAVKSTHQGGNRNRNNNNNQGRGPQFKFSGSMKKGSAPLVLVDIITEDYGRLNLDSLTFKTKQTKKRQKAKNKVSNQENVEYEAGEYFDPEAESAAAAILEQLDPEKLSGIKPNPPSQGAMMFEVNPKGEGRSAMGKTIAIELTPRSQIKVSSAQEDAKWLKMIIKKFPELVPLYDKYARGAPQKYKKVRGGKWKWNNNIYDNKSDMMDAIKKFGTYKDYKGGTTSLRMLKAKRKDNGLFVPWLILIPDAMVRHGDEDSGELIAKKGSADYKPTKMLLELIEGYFGKIKFNKNLGMGGLRLTSPRSKGKKPSAGFKGRQDIPVHEGVKKLYKAEGLKPPSALPSGTSMARPTYYTPSGNIEYQVVKPDGKVIKLQQASEA